MKKYCTLIALAIVVVTGSLIAMPSKASAAAVAMPSQASAAAVAMPSKASAAAVAMPSQTLAATGATQPVSTESTAAADTANTPITAANYNENRGPNLTSSVVLTFDDCPNSLAAYKSVVTYARKINVGLVIAPTGACYDKYMNSDHVDIAKLARQNGQYVINHSRTHPKLSGLTYSRILNQLRGNVVADYGRPPYGDIDSDVRKAYAAKKMRIWLWNVDTEDWTGKSRAQVVSHVTKHAQANNTVLMHMQWNGFSPTAISQMKSGLEKRGLHVCRAYRGLDNAGAVTVAPQFLRNNSLPC
jgi:peptidoglycan-N-acetylglucosamine deacetylase